MRPWARRLGRLPALAVLGLLAGASPPTATVEITVTNVRNDHGHVRAAVCTPDEFLKLHCAYAGKTSAHTGSVTIRIAGIPPGRYAIEVFQDENDNGLIDRSLLGIPEEGLGFSNDARFHFGPPGFGDAAVNIGPDGGRFSVQLRYF